MAAVVATLWEPIPCARAQPQTGAYPPAVSAPAGMPGTPVPLSEALEGLAKRDYDAGRILYESGDFANARLKFDAAFDLSHDPRLLWNAAACERRLRRYARAIALVRRYLATRSPLITAEAARTAQSFLDAAEPLTARIGVEANEPGAWVFVDDVAMGPAPLAPSTRVDLGTHTVAVRKDGFTDYVESLTVVDAVDVHVKAVLRAKLHEGQVVVRAGGRNAIAVDGVIVGEGTWEGLLPSGPHSLRVTPVELSTNYWRPFESQFSVEDDRTRVVDVNIIDVVSQPSKVEVAPRAKGIPPWAWVVGGIALAAGASVVGYFIYQSSQPQATGPIPGTLGTYP
jgi:hypothetical protein